MQSSILRIGQEDKEPQRLQPAMPARPLQASDRSAAVITQSVPLKGYVAPLPADLMPKGIDMSTIPMSPNMKSGDPSQRPIESKRWNWYGAADTANSWAGGGALVGGGVGCAVGAIPTAILGAAAGGVGAVPGAAVGCVGGGEVGAWIGGVTGGFIGWGLGGTSHPWAGGFDWLPDNVITPW